MATSPLIEATISHYRIISSLGAGGTGEVHLAPGLTANLTFPQVCPNAFPNIARSRSNQSLKNQESAIAKATGISRGSVIRILRDGQNP